MIKKPSPSVKRAMESRKDYQTCGLCGTRWFANELLSCPRCEEGVTEGKILRHCPFCAAPARMCKADDGADYIECTQCGASTNLQYSIKDDGVPALKERWNKRVASELTRLRLAEQKLAEFNVEWDGEKYVYNGKD